MTATLRTAPAAPVTRRRFGLLRDKEFRLLWTGETVSSVGSAVTGVALPLVAVSVLHASVFVVTVLTAAAWLPWLLIGLPAGAWVDQLPRRPVMIAADGLSILAFISAPVAAAFGLLTSVQLVLVALVAGTAKVFFATAYKAYMPAILAPEDLLEGNAKLQGSEQAANLAGPGIAGLLAQLASPLGGLVADAASFVVSALCLRRIDHVEVVAPRARTPLRAQIREGLRVLRHDPLLRSNTVFGCVCNFALTGYQSLLVVFLIEDVGLSAGATGLVLAATSTGGIVGALLARPLAARFGEPRAVLLAKCAMPPVGLLIAATTSGAGLALFLVGSMALIGGIVAGNVVYAGFVQRYVPAELLGRVSSSGQVVNFAAIPLGALSAGVLASTAGVRVAMWLMLGVIVASTAILLAGPMRRMREFPTR